MSNNSPNLNKHRWDLLGPVSNIAAHSVSEGEEDSERVVSDSPRGIAQERACQALSETLRTHMSPSRDSAVEQRADTYATSLAWPTSKGTDSLPLCPAWMLSPRMLTRTLQPCGDGQLSNLYLRTDYQSSLRNIQDSFR